MTSTVNLVASGKEFLVYVPLFVENKFDGFILGLFQHQVLLDSVVHVPEGYTIKVFDHQELIYSNDSPLRAGEQGKGEGVGEQGSRGRIPNS